jgi:hypothetical protein
MGIKEGEEVHVKGIRNTINKIIVESFLDLKKVMPFLVQETSRTLNRHDQNRTSLWHIIVKVIIKENKERIL